MVVIQVYTIASGVGRTVGVPVRPVVAAVGALGVL
jgi:hypothetical protein